MAWAGSYRAAPAVQNFTTSASSFAVNKATGTVAGDLILLWCGSNAAGYFSCPGFVAYSTSPNSFYANLLARTADGTEGSTFTVTPASGSGVASIVQATIAGPVSIDAVGAMSTAGNTASANPAAPGLTVAGSNELLLWFGGSISNSANTGTNVATSMPSGFTSRATGITGTVSVPDMLLCDNASVAAGATGSVASTNATTENWNAQMVAIKPTAYAGPAYRATPAVQDFASASTFAVNKATGTVVGDLILLWCAGQAVGTFSCPGFAAGSSGALVGYGQILYRTADGTEGSTFTVSVSGSAGVAEITQATIAGPCSIDVLGTNNGNQSTNPTATGLTVAGANELLLWFGSADDPTATFGATVATTIPSGFTQRAVGTTGTTHRPTVLFCDNTSIAAGATGSIVSTNAANNFWQAQMVAIKPTAYTGPVYRAAPAVQNFTTAATSFAVNKATGVVAGDLILLSFAYEAQTVFSCPGFATYAGGNTGANGFGIQLLARTADGTEGSTFTVVTSSGTAAPEVIQAVIAGPCSIDVVNAGAAGHLTANPTDPGLTVAGSNELLLFFGTACINSNGAGTAVATPSGFTNRVTGTTGTNGLPNVVLCDNTAVAAGATGSVVSPNASTLNSWATQMVAIQPLARPVYRATPTITLSGSTTVATVTKATGTTSGDLILLPVFFAPAGAFTASCPGFTADAAVTSTGRTDYQLLHRVADGTEGSTFTVTISGACYGNFNVGQVVVVNSLIDAAQTTGESGAGGTTSAALAGVTVAGPNERLIWIVDGLLNSNGNGTTPSVPAGITSLVSTAAGTQWVPDTVIGDNATVVSGATGTLTGTYGAAAFWTGAQIAVKINPSTNATVAGPVATSTSAAPAGTVLIGVPGQVAHSVDAAPAGTVLIGVPGQVAHSVDAALSGAVDIGETEIGPVATSVGAAPAGTVSTGWVVPGPTAASTDAAVSGGVGTGVGGVPAAEAGSAPSGALSTGWTVPGPTAASTDAAVSGGVGTGVGGVPAAEAGSAPSGALSTGWTVPGTVASGTDAAPAGTSLIAAPGVPARESAAALPGGVGSGVGGPAATGASAAPAGAVVTGQLVFGVPARESAAALPGSVHFGWTVAGAVAHSSGSAPDGGIYTGPYIGNFCPNPSFEISLAGYTNLTGTAIAQTGTNAAYGHQSMQVMTEGHAPGEGVTGPVVTYYTEAIEGSMGVSLSSEAPGTVVVSAYSSPGAVLLGSVTVELGIEWQRVTLSDLTIYGGDEVYLSITTPTAQSITFLVDAVQYEEQTPAAMYIDGDQPGSEWLGTPGLSASAMPSEFFTILHGGIDIEGTISVVVPGEDFDVVLDGFVEVDGTISSTVTDPIGAFDDFALFELTDPDPAQTYVSWNNAGQFSGESDYTKAYALFHPPLDYPVSGGVNAWNRAQYMAAGFEFVSVPAGAAQNIIRATVENSPLAGATDVSPVPRAYDPPRALHTIVHPSRLNYCPNPSFEVSTADWSAVGTGTLSQVATGLNIVGLGTPPVPNPGINTIVSTPAAAISPGQQVSASIYAYAPSVLSQSLVLQVAWLDSFGNPLLSGVSAGSPVAPVVATWTRLSVTGIAPLNAVYYVLQVTYASVPLSTDLVWVGNLVTCVSSPPTPPSYSSYARVPVTGWSCNTGGGTATLDATYVPLPFSGTYRAAPAVQNFSPSGASTYTVTAAAGIEPGDLILLWVSSFYGVAWGVTGFTPLVASNISYPGSAFFMRVADGTEGSTFTVVGGNAGCAVTQAVVAGPASIDVAGGYDYGTPGYYPTYSGFTVAAANELLLWWGAASYNTAYAAVIGTTPTGFASRAVGTSAIQYVPDILLCDETPSAGSTGSVGPGTASSNYYWMTQMTAVVVPPFPNGSVTSGGSGNAVLITPSGVPAVIPPDTTPHSMKIIAATAGDGAEISIPDLIVGDTYTVSCYAQPGAGMTDVLSCPDGTATALGRGVLSDEWTTGGWTRLWFTFQATASTVTLAVTSGIGTSYVDCVLVEIGSLVGVYFDGAASSADYGWEADGTAGLTRSYYYENLFVSQQTIQDTITKHAPMGVIALAPQYFTPYTQAQG